MKKTHCKNGHPRTTNNLDTKRGCKECNKERCQRYYQTHTEECNKQSTEWRKAHPEYYNEQTTEWRKAHPERFREINRKSARKLYQENPEKHRKVAREWAKANPEQRRAQEHKREARKRGNGGSWTVQEWLELKKLYRHLCLCCLRSEEELALLGLKLVTDHIQPLIKGGRNSIENLQPLCHGLGGCNNIKGAKWIDYRPSFPLEIV